MNCSKIISLYKTKYTVVFQGCVGHYWLIKCIIALPLNVTWTKPKTQNKVMDFKVACVDTSFRLTVSWGFSNIKQFVYRQVHCKVCTSVTVIFISFPGILPNRQRCQYKKWGFYGKICSILFPFSIVLSHQVMSCNIESFIQSC